MSQLPIFDQSRPRDPDKMVDGLTWAQFEHQVRKLARDYRNGMLDRRTYENRKKDLERKREQFLR